MLRLSKDFAKLYEVHIFDDVMCCTITLCAVMMMIQVEIIVKYIFIFSHYKLMRIESFYSLVFRSRKIHLIRWFYGLRHFMEVWHLVWYFFRARLDNNFQINFIKLPKILNNWIGIYSQLKYNECYRQLWSMHRNPCPLDALEFLSLAEFNFKR